MNYSTLVSELPALRTRITTENFGKQILHVETLENLDQTIDELFEWLQSRETSVDKQPVEKLLEELCPYFGVIWPSSRALAIRIAESAFEFRAKSVLELGCGLAVPSLIASRIGAFVTATDFHPQVPEMLARNLRHNALSHLRYHALNWAKLEGPELQALGQFDWVIASDVLYESHQPKILAAAIDHVLKPGGAALIADPARPYLQAFVDEMKARGYEVETEIVESAEVHEVRTDIAAPRGREIFLLSLKR